MRNFFHVTLSLVSVTFIEIGQSMGNFSNKLNFLFLLGEFAIC